MIAIRIFAIKIIDETSWDSSTKQKARESQENHFPTDRKMVFLRWQEIRHHRVRENTMARILEAIFLDVWINAITAVKEISSVIL